MPAPRSRVTGLVAAGLLAAAVAACGGSSGPSGSSANGVATEPVATVLKDSARAGDSLRSLRMSGTLSDQGKTYALDLRLEAGVGSTGTLSYRGHSLQIVTAGAYTFLRGGQGFWRAIGAPAAYARLLSGTWLRSPDTGGAFSGFARLGDLKDLFAGALGFQGRFVKTGATIVAGSPALGLRNTTHGGTLYVATTGKPYPLEVTDVKTVSRLRFSDFNASVTVTAPKSFLNTPSGTSA